MEFISKLFGQATTMIPDDSFDGAWMDLGGNDGASESEEDSIEDSEIEEDSIEDSEMTKRVKSSFYFFRNMNKDEEEVSN